MGSWSSMAETRQAVWIVWSKRRNSCTKGWQKRGTGLGEVRVSGQNDCSEKIRWGHCGCKFRLGLCNWLSPEMLKTVAWRLLLIHFNRQISDKVNSSWLFFYVYFFCRGKKSFYRFFLKRERMQSNDILDAMLPSIFPYSDHLLRYISWWRLFWRSDFNCCL